MSELPPPAWVHWPIRVLAVIFVLPFRLLWELLRYAGRFLARYVGRPLAWLWHYAVAVPLAFLWRYLVAVPLAFVWRYLIAVPVAFLWHYLIAVPASWLWEQAIRPALAWLWRHRRFLIWPFAMLLRYLVILPLGWLWAVTAPMWRGLARGIAAVLLAGWQGAGWVLRQLYRWLLRPAGLAVAWCWRHTVVPAYRMVAAGGRWVREEILQPAASVVRAVLVSLGLRR
jgi:hypothetical protein